MTLGRTRHTAAATGRRGDRLSRQVLVLSAVVVLGTIMTVLDLTIVNVAIPTLGTDLHASIPAIQWVLTGYMLAFAAVIPLTGWAAEWIFLINLPVGGAALLAAWRLLPDARPQLGQRLDVRGLVLLCPGIAVFLYGMSEAGSHGGFASPRTIMAALAGLALIALFFWHATTRGPDALIDISLLRRRGFAAAAALNLLLMVALFGSLILIPLYYQVVRHDSPLRAGLLLVPQGIGAALALALAGRMTDKAGARAVVPAGLVIAMLGMLAYTQVGAQTSVAYPSGALLVIGMGLGATIAPSMAAAFQALSRVETPRGTSALNAIQRIAGAIGTALFAIIVQHVITARLPRHPGGTTAMAALSQQARAHTAAAVAGAFGTTFWVAVALIASALVPALLLPRPPRDDQAAASQSAGQARPSSP